MSRLPYSLRAVSPDCTVNWSSLTNMFLEPSTWSSSISPFFIKSRFTGIGESKFRKDISSSSIRSEEI